MTGELTSKYTIRCQTNACINRDGSFWEQDCVSGDCNIDTRVSGQSSVFKLQLQQKDIKTAWNRERGHPNTYHYASALGRLLRLFVTDSDTA